MGEAALRKLAGAVRSEPMVDLKGKGKAKPQETMEGFFDKTVRSVVGDKGSFEFGPIVNCDQANWRREGAAKGPRGKRKGVAEEKTDAMVISD